MKIYKFSTKVSNKGTIRIPDDSDLRNQEVEVIVISSKKEKGSKMKASEFVNKWAGYLSDVDTNQAKKDYLTEKYR